MGSDDVIYVPSFIKIYLGVQKLIGGGIQTHTHTESHVCELINLIYFFKIRKVG
jgi:hypothetical protein